MCTLEEMTSAALRTVIDDEAVNWAQLHLALASVSYITGDADRSRAECEAVLAEPGLPAPLYAAAHQHRILALLTTPDEARHCLAGCENHEVHECVPAALIARAALAWRDGHVGDTLELLWAAVRARPGCSRDGCYPALGLAVVFAALGQVDDAQACVLTAADEIALGADPLWAAAPAVFSARIDLAGGQLDEARTTAQAGLDLATELATLILTPIARDVLIGAAIMRGELGDAADQLERWRAEAPSARLPFGTPHRQWAAIRLRDAQGTRLLGDAASEAAFDLVASDRCLLLEEPSAAAWLVRVAHRDGDQRRVRAVVRTMEDLAGTNRRYPSVVAAAAHAKGVAEQDLACLESAATAHRSPWARASAAEDAADVCAQRGDKGSARSWFERAAEAYSRCGATRDGARIRSRLRDLGVQLRHWSRQDRPVWGWDSLTETEQAVAGLVAEGLSNQQVATRMFLSRHTVDFHLRHIFRKLGIGSRVVLTRIALANEAAGL